MRTLVDTNLFLDVLLDRPGLAKESERALNIFRRGSATQGWISWHTLSNLYYVGTNQVGRTQALDEIDLILRTFQVASVGTRDALAARRLPMKDFEDALQSASALAVKADHILTRNIPDYRYSPIPAISPKQFLDLSENKTR